MFFFGDKILQYYVRMIRINVVVSVRVETGPTVIKTMANRSSELKSSRKICQDCKPQ